MIIQQPAESTQQRKEQAPYFILGIDLGIASCGFCLIDFANHKICEMGSHLFNAPQEPKTKTSLAKARRNSRSARRNIRRTRDRLTHMLRCLKGEGLVPKNAEKNWFQPRKGEISVLELRALGLDQLLSDRQFAQVLYSLAGRRGYIPHGTNKAGKASTGDDENKVLKAIEQNTKRLKKGGFRTVGEMLWKQDQKHRRSRNKSGNYEFCVSNSQIIEEVETLFDRQSAFGNKHTENVFKKKYLEVLKWQKPTASQDDRVYETVGTCTYFKEEKRAAIADVSSELLRAHERFANLRIIEEDGTETSLPYNKRREFIDILFSSSLINNNEKCKVTYSKIRKLLDLSARCSFKGIDANEENKKEVFEPKAWRTYRNSNIAPVLLDRMKADLEFGDAIGEALTYASSKESLAVKLDDLDIEENERAILLELPYASKVFKGYGSRSRKAQYFLLDAFEDESIGSLYEAEQACGLADLRLKQARNRQNCLIPYSIYDPTCTNPVVLRALSRMRRIVNAIIRIYGVPHEIHIELGRELKHSVKEKKAILKANKKNAEDKKRIADIIARIKGCPVDDVRGKDIDKYRLWEEQGNLDIYTNDKIDCERLVKEENYCEIDHALPYSRTCDNSRNNKVLVLAKSNQDKAERSPYEWMASKEASSPSWEDFCARIQASKLPQKKKEKLLEKNLADKEQEFIDRNLNDTRYMCRAAKAYLEDTLAFPTVEDKKQHVYAVAGGATALLRRSWGLNFETGDAKDRTDNRHHAVDATVIAACSTSHVKKVAKVSACKHRVPRKDRARLFADTQPWKDFASDVRQAREKIIPTRMVDHGMTGQMFEETLYRFDNINAKGKAMLFYHKDGKPQATVSGNFSKVDDVSARKLGKMAFLRLWFNAKAKKGKGAWYGEPVYYADYAAIKRGTYVPRYMKAHFSRQVWPEVPASAKKEKPLTLYPGDVLSINGKAARFIGVGIAGMKWIFRDIATNVEIKEWPTINKLSGADEIKIIEEDVLGRCYYRISEG